MSEGLVEGELQRQRISQGTRLGCGGNVHGQCMIEYAKHAASQGQQVSKKAHAYVRGVAILS